jgi:hypothetical protein
MIDRAFIVSFFIPIILAVLLLCYAAWKIGFDERRRLTNLSLHGPKAGQLWFRTFGLEISPFVWRTAKPYRFRKIIEVRNGFVLHSNMDGEDESDASIEWFMRHYIKMPDQTTECPEWPT